MSLLNAKELKTLLDQCKNVDLEDAEGTDDYAYLEETIFPTLLPALVKLLERLEGMGVEANFGGGSDEVKHFNSIRWLAEYLVRYHPDGGVFKDKHESAYAAHLESVAVMRKEQRLQRELLVKEQTRKEEEEKLYSPTSPNLHMLELNTTIFKEADIQVDVRRQELERTQEEERERHEKDEQRKIEAEKKRQEENEKGETAVLAEAGPEYGSVVLKLRGNMMRLLSDHDFISAETTAAIESKLCKEACQFLAVNSHATFTAVGELLDPDTLFYHTAGDKKEFVAEDFDEEEEEELEGMPQAKKVPDPEITVRDLPPKENDVAYILKRGNGLTFETVVDEGQYKFIADAKYTEGVFFFEEKRPGTYLAVPLRRAGAIAGVICGDTLDSVAGTELVESEHILFHAVSVVLSEALDKAVWSLMDAKRTVHTARLSKLASDAGTMPETIAREAVEAVDVVFPGHLVSVGVVDTAVDMRLVFSSNRDGSHARNSKVSMASGEEQVLLMFDAKQQGKTAIAQDAELTKTLAVAVPILKGARVSAVLYAGADPSGPGISKDVQDLVQEIAAIVSPILLPPEENALRVMRILALSGVGSPTVLYDMAAQLCVRYTGATEVMVGMAHGVGAVRVVRVSKGGEEGSPAAPVFKEEVVKLADKPACAEAMASLQCVTKGGWIGVPLVTQTGARSDCVGVMAVQCVAVDQVQERTLEGVAVALTSAMQVSEMRRKMGACAEKALESLLKRAPVLPGAYLAYFDVSGRQLCAKAIGEVIPGVEVGKVIEQTDQVQTAAIQREGEESVLGLIGVPAAVLKELSVGMHEESPWDTIKDVAATMGEVSTVLSGEPLLMDAASEAIKLREELLATHFNAARFDLVTAATVSQVDLKYIDALRTARPFPVVVQIVQAIMYILGHQERDVSEWPKCRKLVTHHLFKEMRMIDVRKPLKVHKLKLARACIEGLEPHDIVLEVGPKPLAIWRWVCMILDVQGV